SAAETKAGRAEELAAGQVLDAFEERVHGGQFRFKVSSRFKSRLTTIVHAAVSSAGATPRGFDSPVATSFRAAVGSARYSSCCCARLAVTRRSSSASGRRDRSVR